MAKILTLALCLVGVVIVQGDALSYEDVFAAANTGQWNQVQGLLSADLAEKTAFRPAAFNNVHNPNAPYGGQPAAYNNVHNPNAPYGGQPAAFNNVRNLNAPYGGQPAAFNNVRNLKPPHGGQVYGEAEYSYHTASNIDGKTSQDAGGHKIINNNGRVKEFNFTPTGHLPQYNVHQKDLYPSPIHNKGVSGFKHVQPAVSFSSVRNLKPIPDGQVYGEAEYTYHTASNINGKTSEDAGGHKVINNNGHVKEFNIKPTPGKYYPGSHSAALPPLPPLPPLSPQPSPYAY